MTKRTIPIRDEDDAATTRPSVDAAVEAEAVEAEVIEGEVIEDEGAADEAGEAKAEEGGDGFPSQAGGAAPQPDDDEDEHDEAPREAERGPESASVGVDPAVVARLLADNERLKRALDEKDQLLQKYIAAYKKAEAEFARAKTRLEADVGRRVDAGRGDLARKLLGVLDDLERSLTAARGASGNLGTLLEGVEMVYKSFLARLGELGVERYDPAGQPFDPGVHEAMGVVPAPTPEQNNRVLQVFAAGYRQGDQVLRPARVIVGKNAG